MKTIVCLFVLSFAISLCCFSQSTEHEFERLLFSWNINKKEIISKHINLEKDDIFWRIYTEYEYELKDIEQARLNILDYYIKYYDDFDKKSEAIIENSIYLEKK